MNLSLQSRIKLFPLVIRQDNKNYIVEDSSSGEFYEMPALAVEAIKQINEEKLLYDIESDLKQNYPAEQVDILEFTKQLFELGLIKEIDGELVLLKKEDKTPKGFLWIPPKTGQIFFNSVSMKVYPAIILFNILLLFFNTELFPHYRNLFVFEAMMANILSFMALSLVLILIHEFGHILAIRAHGLPANLEIGHRLFLVVFETDLTPAWKLKPKQRNRLYLAGLYFDQCMIFLALILTLVFPQADLIFRGILGIVVLDLFIKTIYQCCLYLKTDLYYLFENITGCYNLMENGIQYLRKWLPFIRKTSKTNVFENEEHVVKLYSIFYIAGMLLTGCLFIFYFIPQLLYSFSVTLPGLSYPFNHPLFWDAVVFIGQMFLVVGLLIYSWNKKNRTERLPSRL